MDSLTAREDHEADIRRSISLDIVEVDLHALVAPLDLLALLDENFEALKNVQDGIRVLGNGELTKKLTVRANGFTKSAEEKITAAGGKVEVI